MSLSNDIRLILRPLSLLFVVLFLTSPMSAFATQTTEVGSSSADTEIQERVEASGIPSVHAGIIVNDTLVWAKGYDDQPTLDTGFRAGSITKTFVATALVQLHENGTIDLDDDVSDYLPFDVRNPNEPETVITIRMVLEHEAGMALFHQFGYPWSDPVLDQVLDELGIADNYALPRVPDWNGVRVPLRDLINSTNINNPDLWLPATGGRAYSNTGYLFLSFLLEYITNTSWTNYIQENIRSPLEMDNTGFNETEYSGPVAIPHTTVDNGSLVPLPTYRDYGYGAGALITTVSDLSRFLIALMNGGRYEGVQILGPASATLANQYLHLAGDMPGYYTQTSLFEASNGQAGLILFVNQDHFGNVDSAYTTNRNEIWSALLDEIRPPTTTLTSTLPAPDVLFLGSLAIGGIVVVVVLVLVLKRR